MQEQMDLFPAARAMDILDPKLAYGQACCNDQARWQPEGTDLRNEDDGGGLIQCGPIHVDCRPQWQHKADDAFGTAQLGCTVHSHLANSKSFAWSLTNAASL